MGRGRAVLRRSLELGLHRIGVPGLARWWRRGRVLILAYHNVVPDGAEPTGERSLHLPQREFAAQLDLLVETHRIIPLSSLWEPREERDRPCAVLTFDDGYRGAMTAGVQELAARGVPGTFFVVPSFLGDHTFWWDALANPGDGTMPGDARVHALEILGGDEAAVRRWARDTGLPLHEMPAYARTATEDELRVAGTIPGIALESHTWSHRSLSRIGPADLAEELRRSREWVREHLGAVGDWCSCPYGDWSPGVAAAAAAAGYRGALRLDGGWVPEGVPAPFGTPRLNIPAGMSVGGFRLRIDGVMAR